MGITAAVPTRFRLDDLLAELGISQRELARRSGVSLVTVHAIANNKTATVALATLDAIAEALGIQPGELLEREPDAKRKRGR